MKPLFSILSAGCLITAILSTDWIALTFFILSSICLLYRIYLYWKEKYEARKWKEEIKDVFSLTEYFED